MGDLTVSDGSVANTTDNQSQHLQPLGENSANLLRPNESGWVDARRLHQSLGVETRFTMWIKRRIAARQWIEGIDYETFSQVWEKGRPTEEFLISLTMAEHLCLMENTEAAHQVRRLYIACRRQADDQRLQIANLSEQVRLLTAPKRRRVPGQGIVEFIKRVVIETDIFHLEEKKVVTERKAYGLLTEDEKRRYRTEHRARVMRGLSERQDEEINYVGFPRLLGSSPKKAGQRYDA